MLNTIDITESGCPITFYRLPNGSFNDLEFKHNGEIYRCAWKKYDKSIVRTINIINIESFNELSYPIVDIKITNKNVSWWKKFWYSDWKPEILYDIKINVIEMKNVTYIKMRSGNKFMVDESSDFLKNALDVCVWSTDFLESLKK